MSCPLFRPLAQTVARALFSVIFIGAGLNHLVRPEQVASRLEQSPQGAIVASFASPTLLVLLAGIALLAGGVALLAGFKTRLAAVGLALVLVPITLTVQVGAADAGPLLKNIAILGALLHFAVTPPSGFGVDAALLSRRRDQRFERAEERAA